MFENVLFICFIISYLAMVAALVKGLNPTLVLLVTGIVWAILGGNGLSDILNNIIGVPIVNNSTSLLTILFGSWFAQVLVQTGIVSSIIRTAVEVGGDKPQIIVAVIMVVVSALFTSLFSIGPVIAVGVIVLPVMISLGVKPRIAVVAYGSSVGVATLLNVSQYALLRGLVPYGHASEAFGNPWTPYAFIAFAIGVCINVIGIQITMFFTNPKRKKVKSWGIKKSVDSDDVKYVPWYVCIATFIPVILVMAFKVNIFSSFLIGGIYAIIATKLIYRRVRIFPTFSKTFKSGLTESSGMVIYMICTYIIVAGANEIKPIIEKTVGEFLPTTTLGFALLMAIGIPFLMYRGPLAIGGAGAALFATVNAIGVIPNQFLWMMAYTASGIHYGLDPTNSSNVWTCSYAKVKPMEFIKTALPISWAYGASIIALLYVMHG